MQTPVDNPLMTIESFNKQFHLREKESCYAMRHAPCAMQFSIPERRSLRDCRQKQVIGCRRLGNGIGDGPWIIIWALGIFQIPAPLFSLGLLPLERN
jgi:hypothetical protein